MLDEPRAIVTIRLRHSAAASWTGSDIGDRARRAQNGSAPAVARRTNRLSHSTGGQPAWAAGTVFLWWQRFVGSAETGDRRQIAGSGQAAVMTLNLSPEDVGALQRANLPATVAYRPPHTRPRWG